MDGAMGGFKEWPLVLWPTTPLPYGPRRPMMKINTNWHYSCQNRIFLYFNVTAVSKHSRSPISYIIESASKVAEIL